MKQLKARLLRLHLREANSWHVVLAKIVQWGFRVMWITLRLSEL